MGEKTNTTPQVNPMLATLAGKAWSDVLNQLVTKPDVLAEARNIMKSPEAALGIVRNAAGLDKIANQIAAQFFFIKPKNNDGGRSV